jgi:hypothetical protein
MTIYLWIYIFGYSLFVVSSEIARFRAGPPRAAGCRGGGVNPTRASGLVPPPIFGYNAWGKDRRFAKNLTPPGQPQKLQATYLDLPTTNPK